VRQAGYLQGSYQDARPTTHKIILSVCFTAEWNTYFELTTHLPRPYDFRDDCTEVQFCTFKVPSQIYQQNHIKKN